MSNVNAYLYGPGGTPIEQITGSTVTFLHQDQLGSTRLLTDATGTVTGTYQFDPYGNTASHTGSASTPLQYAGQYLDAESGLYWMRARYYDPSTGQFVSRDPLAAISNAPYSYGFDSPTNAVDPSGLICVHVPMRHDNCDSFWKQHPAIQKPLIAAAVAPAAVAACIVACVEAGAAMWTGEALAAGAEVAEGTEAIAGEAVFAEAAEEGGGVAAESTCGSAIKIVEKGLMHTLRNHQPEGWCLPARACSSPIKS